MKCDNCGKNIPDGQKYHCLSYSLERIDGDSIAVDYSEALEVRCLDCGANKRVAKERKEEAKA